MKPGLGGAVLAPLWAGLTAAFAAAVPIAAPLLFPAGAARLTRSLFGSSARKAFVVTALAPLAGLVLAVLLHGPALIAALGALVLVALPALALFAGARDGRRMDELVLLVTAVTGIGGLSVILGLCLVEGRDPGLLLAGHFAELIPDQVAFYRTTAGWSDTALIALVKGLSAWQYLLAEHLPGLVLAGAVVYAAILVYPIGPLAGLPLRDLSEQGFVRFRTPVLTVALFVPAGLLTALGSGLASRLAVDVLLPLAILFFLRGIAIIRALLDRGHAGLIERGLAYTLVVTLPVIPALGGLFDEFFDIRERLERAASTPDIDD